MHRPRCAVVAVLAVFAGPLPAASPRPIALFLVQREEPVAPELTPAGRAAVREGQRLRARFLAALGKVEGVKVVTDESLADARLEVLEATVHRDTAIERTQRKDPQSHVRQGRPEDTDISVSHVFETDYALTVRVTAGDAFTDFSSSTRDSSASSAVGTVIGKLRGWVRARPERAAGGS